MMNSVQSEPNAILVRRLDLSGLETSRGSPRALSVVVKDCIDIAGTITGCGSAAFAGDAPAEAHAEVVKSLLEAGCRVIGKANMHELAFGVTGINAYTGTPINPHWPEIIPGGSSSGSAVAVAAGLCDFSIGTDTGGSVRQPAICCGVYGIKPTFGRISRVGCRPALSSLDCVGVLARTAFMLTRGMQLIDPGFTPVTLEAAPKLARLTASCDLATTDRRLSGFMDDLPTIDTIGSDLLDAAFEAGMKIINAETAAAFGHLIDSDAPLGDDIRARLIAARDIAPEAITKAENMRTNFAAVVDHALENVDAIITPALPMPPPTLEGAKDPKTVLPLTRFLRPFNLSGHPAIVLPLTPMDNALPIGVQIIGRKGDDARLCAIAGWMADTILIFRNEDSVL